jgi:hypothetical protein
MSDEHLPGFQAKCLASMSRVQGMPEWQVVFERGPGMQLAT